MKKGKYPTELSKPLAKGHPITIVVEGAEPPSHLQVYRSMIPVLMSTHTKKVRLVGLAEMGKKHSHHTVS
jgi:hypothetical protein